MNTLNQISPLGSEMTLDAFQREEADQEHKTQRAFQAMIAAKRVLKKTPTESAQAEYNALKEAWLEDKKKLAVLNAPAEIPIESPETELDTGALMANLEIARNDIQAFGNQPRKGLFETVSANYKKVVDFVQTKATTLKDEMLLALRTPTLAPASAGINYQEYEKESLVSISSIREKIKKNRGDAMAMFLAGSIALNSIDLKQGLTGVLDNFTFGPAEAVAAEYYTAKGDGKESVKTITQALGITESDWEKIKNSATGAPIFKAYEKDGVIYPMLHKGVSYSVEGGQKPATSLSGSSENVRMIIPENIKRQIQEVNYAQKEVQEGITVTPNMKAVAENCAETECYKKVLKEKPFFSITRNVDLLKNREALEGVNALKELLTSLTVCEKGPLVNIEDLKKELTNKNSAFRQALLRAGCFQKTLAYIDKYGFDLNERGYGESTRILVAKFQDLYNRKLDSSYLQKTGKKLKLDGVVGNETWSALEAESNLLKDGAGDCLVMEAPIPVIAPDNIKKSVEQPKEQPSCETGDCVPQVETPAYLSSGETVVEAISFNPLVIEYQTKVKNFVEKINTQTSLSELVAVTGITRLQKDNRFAKGSFEAEKEEIIRQLAKSPDRDVMDNLRALEESTNLLASAIAQKITGMETEVSQMDARDPRRADFYGLINYLISLQGLSQLKMRTDLWDLNDQSGDVTKVVRFPHQVYATYALQFTSPASRELDKLEKKNLYAENAGAVTRSEIESIPHYQDFRHYLEELQKANRPAKLQEHPLAITDIKALENVDGHFVGNNAYYNWPTVSFEDASKAFDSTVLLIPRWIHSLYSLAKNELADNHAYNTQAFELPMYSGMQKGWFSTYAEINADLPNNQRYNYLMKQVRGGGEEKVVATTAFDQATGFGLISKDGLKVDGQDARLADKNRLGAVLATLYAPELIPADQGLLSTMLAHVLNIDLGAIFENISPAIPDTDINIIPSVDKFQKNDYGQSLIRLYQAEGKNEAEALKCAWEFYSKTVQLVLKKLPKDAPANLSGVCLGQFFNIPSQIDGADVGTIAYLIKIFSGGDSTPKPGPEGHVTGGQSGQINPPINPVSGGVVF